MHGVLQDRLPRTPGAARGDGGLGERRAARRRARLGDGDLRDGTRRGHASPSGTTGCRRWPAGSRRSTRSCASSSDRHTDAVSTPDRVKRRHTGGLVLPESAQGVTSRRRKTATGVPPPVVLVVRRPRRHFDVETTEFSGAPQGDDSRPDAHCARSRDGVLRPCAGPHDGRRHRAGADAERAEPAAEPGARHEAGRSPLTRRLTAAPSVDAPQLRPHLVRLRVAAGSRGVGARQPPPGCRCR